MNFKEYKQKIENIPVTATLKYDYAVIWLHPERLPLGVVSLGDDAGSVIRIPARVVKGYYTVPVIAISKTLFKDNDKVTDIILPSSLSAIPANAFSGCSSLRRITIPKSIKTIREGTFLGCSSLEDVYYEGTMEDWKKINIVHHKHEITFGELKSGTPVQNIETETLRYIPGNEPLLTSNIHFNCLLPDTGSNFTFEIRIGNKDATDFFSTM